MRTKITLFLLTGVLILSLGIHAAASAATFTGLWFFKRQAPAAPPAPSASEEPGSGFPLPWEADPEFIQAQSANNTPVLLGSYQAPLKDPLPGEAFNIAHAADILKGTVVQPGELFSQNRRVGPYSGERGFREGPTYSGNRIIRTTGGGVCKIASLLYNVAILANLEIVERHPHSLTVPYVPPGQDATVAYGVLDFKFKNSTPAPILIWSQFKDNSLFMAFYGREPSPTVTWRHQELSRTSAGLEYVINPSLEPGQEREIMPGQEGVSVHSWITVTFPDGREETRDLGVNTYASSPRVIERGPAGRD